jgi:hypothetical protein
MAERPATVSCSCGQEAVQVIRSVPECFVRFRPYEFNPAKVVGNNGERFGRTREQQHEKYRRDFDLQKRLVRERSHRPSKKNDIQYLGGMPGEMADSLAEQEGDKNVVLRDPETFLKKTGLYVGEGQG